MYQKYIKTLMSSPLFAGMDKRDSKKLVGCLRPSISKYSKGDIIKAEGTDIKKIGIVVSGTVNITKTGPAGNRILLDTVIKGDIFGETAAFSKKGEWPATVESQTDAKVLFISAASITAQCRQMCPAHTQIQRNMLSILAEKSLGLTRRMEYMGMKKLNAKICTYLLDIKKDEKENSITVPMKRCEMAEFFNVERPSLSRALVNLKKQKIIDFKGRRIKILDLEKLKNISSGMTS